MRTRPRLVEILKFGRHRTPGFGISQGFYLSVLASRMPLPSLREVVTPKGEDGSVMGFGVPLSKEATKDCLSCPMERGAYAVAAPDQKTVLRLLVMSKEEAGFSPPACVESARALNLSDEVRGRLLATWSIAQLTFEAHHPMVFPAVRFALSVASRIASLAEGLVADPVSRSYRLPEDVPSPATTDEALDVRDVVAVKTATDGRTARSYTLGMQKFGLPEFEMEGYPAPMAPLVEELLYAVGQQHLAGRRLAEGDTLGAMAAPLGVARGGGDWLGAGVLCHRLVSIHDSMDRSLAAWAAEEGDEQAARV